MKLFNLFKGLTTEYYFRQLFFGALFAGFIIFMDMQGEGEPKYGLYAMAVINTLLYPYSRFAYETIMNFLIGNNMFIIDITWIFIIWKIFIMAICFSLAIFIAPIGLLFIYFYQKKNFNKNS